MGAIIGIISGCCLFLLLIVCGLVYYRRYRRRKGLSSNERISHPQDSLESPVVRSYLRHVNDDFSRHRITSNGKEKNSNASLFPVRLSTSLDRSNVFLFRPERPTAHRTICWRKTIDTNGDSERLSVDSSFHFVARISLLLRPVLAPPSYTEATKHLRTTSIQR